MTTDAKTDPGPLSAEAAALARDELERQAAAVPSPAADQAATAAAMTERGPTLPAEADMEEFMGQMQAQMADMQAQMLVLKQQAAEAVAAQGIPLPVRYAQGAADKIAALVLAHPDAPRDHFLPVVAAAEALTQSAAKLVDGSGLIGDLKDAYAAVEKFATRTHWRTWGKHIDWSSVLYDCEEAVEAGLKLAA